MAEQDATGEINLSGDGGVLKEIIQEGTSVERPHDGCTVSLHYTGTLADGTVFHSSIKPNEPFDFELGKGRAIKGFEMFIPTMRKGEKAVFTCAPEYGYGPADSPPDIPANSTLRFELELLDWKPEDLSPKSDGGIIRYIITPTTKKGKTPNEGGLVKAHLIGKFEDRIFDERDVSFVVGEESDDEVISGVQTAVQKFGKGETSRLVIKPEYAFGKKGHKEWNIPPNSTVQYTVTLKNFEKEVKASKLNEEERIEQAKIYTEKGKKFLKDEKFKLAIRMYEKSNTFLSNCSNDESTKLKAAVLLSIAFCSQKLSDKEVEDPKIETFSLLVGDEYTYLFDRTNLAAIHKFLSERFFGTKFIMKYVSKNQTHALRTENDFEEMPTGIKFIRAEKIDSQSHCQNSESILITRGFDGETMVCGRCRTLDDLYKEIHDNFKNLKSQIKLKYIFNDIEYDLDHNYNLAQFNSHNINQITIIEPNCEEIHAKGRPTKNGRPWNSYIKKILNFIYRW